jgi:hypothetical protein
MELLKDIVSFSGKSGLFRILKPGRSGIIVESLDEKREKQIAGSTARVSVLKDISMFMADGHEATPLATILGNVHAKYQGTKIDAKALSDYQLTDFMAEVLPGYDTERVYLSDIKKLINWYNILTHYVPELFETTGQTEATAQEVTTQEIMAEEVIAQEVTAQEVIAEEATAEKE